MDSYRKYCEEVVDKVKGSNGSVEDIKTFVMTQIVFHGLDKNKYISTLISYLDSSMGIWDKGRVDVFGLFHELSKFVDDTPPVTNAEGEKVLRQRLSAVLTDEQLNLLVGELPIIAPRDLRRNWYDRKKYRISGLMTLKGFFELCTAVVPQRNGVEGWTYENYKRGYLL